MFDNVWRCCTLNKKNVHTNIVPSPFLYEENKLDYISCRKSLLALSQFKNL